ncbi:DUF29 domain-containing protein [Endozoicomonas sp. ONNA1]|uniref:DUF29 domain-containing protein n=1 Tax=Endozoicomonas sp. ONNA1 TaxID=2828740 RepID=UPI0021495FD0|nr:DUF29 domain-containing protein [Endozoicomonas sp. ONNA1]
MNNLYHTDHHKWLTQQLALLANKEFDKLDLDNLLEELELSIDDKIRELKRRLRTLIAHLLKCDYQTTILKDACNNHFVKKWLGTIKRTRIDIVDLFEKNHSLKNYVKETMVKAYQEAKEEAIDGMNIHARNAYTPLDDNSFPDTCPWSFEQIMETEWYPLNGVSLDD